MDLVIPVAPMIPAAPEKVYVPEAAETVTLPGVTSLAMVTVPPAVFEKVTLSPST